MTDAEPADKNIQTWTIALSINSNTSAYSAYLLELEGTRYTKAINITDDIFSHTLFFFFFYSVVWVGETADGNHNIINEVHF